MSVVELRTEALAMYMRRYRKMVDEQEASDMGQRRWPVESHEFSAEMTDLIAEAIEIAHRNGFAGNELKDSVWRHLMVEGARYFAKCRE